MSNWVKVLGFDSTVRKLRQLGPKLGGQALKEAVLAGAQPIVDDARANAPRETGRLADNIVARVVKSDAQHTVVHVGPTKDVFYGGFVELGTVKMAAKPFLRPAFDKHAGSTMIKRMNERLVQVIQQLARRK